MNKPNSEHPFQLLAEYASDELDEAEAQQVRRHILDCPACLQAVEDYRLIVEAEAAATEREFSQELHDSTLMKILGRPSRDTLARHAAEKQDTSDKEREKG